MILVVWLNIDGLDTRLMMYLSQALGLAGRTQPPAAGMDGSTHKRFRVSTCTRMANAAGGAYDPDPTPKCVCARARVFVRLGTQNAKSAQRSLSFVWSCIHGRTS